MKNSDYELIRKIKEQVTSLPDLEIPPEDAYIIIETDGCMDGWGGVCKWKKRKQDPRKDEKICAYASGKFKAVQSTIDAEINACTNSLDKLKIYYLDKKEITLRTDCQAIISFYNKTNSNKASRVRWLRFADLVTGTGVLIHIEHIDGKANVLADSLSRLVNLCFAGCTGQMQEVLQKGLTLTEELLTDSKHSRTKKTGLEQIMKISIQCQEYFKDHPPLLNLDPCIGTSNSKPIDQEQDQSRKMMHFPMLPCNSSTKQPEKQLKLYETSKQWWTSKPKSVSQSAQEITTGMTIGPISSNKIEKLDTSLLSLRPYATNWAETQSRYRKMFHRSSSPNLLEAHVRDDDKTHKPSNTWWKNDDMVLEHGICRPAVTLSCL